MKKLTGWVDAASLPAMLRLVLIIPVALLCAAWPQGFVLCVGAEGHLDFEIEGSPPCPAAPEGDSDEDCRECVDRDSPDLVGATTAVPIARAADHPAGHPNTPDPALGPADSPPLAASSPLAALSTVVLLV